MFTVRVTHPSGESREFPLEIFKSEIFVGLTWEPCASFNVPEEAGEFLNDEYASDCITYAFLEGCATKGSFENQDDDEVHWELLINGVSCTHEEFSDSAWQSMNTNTYKVPRSLDHKYMGCGSGIVVVDKAKHQVIDFEYTDVNLHPISEQNIEMCEDAGKIIREDDRTITYRANFSSYTICLY